MKTTTVPAQITTVEDKIVGNLTWQQMVLLASPVFIDFTLYVSLPANLKLNIYKLVLMVTVVFVASSLAIRIKSKIVLMWIITLIRYNVRPRYYVFDKNSTYLRDANVLPEETTPHTIPNKKESDQQELIGLSQDDIFKLECIMAKPSTELKYATNKRGGLHVSITEVK